MLGSVEAARLITFARRVTLVATTAVEMLTQNGTGTVNYVDLHFAVDSTMVIFPQILQDAAQKHVSWGNDIEVSIASVVFTPNPSPARRIAGMSRMSFGTAVRISERAGCL
jgi:hypothetical protein